ncbi:MAG: helix-turn-helix transcriptional regulator [Alistipes sp.]|uniref:helix-turn-helix domain-containing protein n=1 Tax=Alistipes sp. TaxID=1872444 RepID=UPI0025BA3A0D|nr:helix-turn-helix transcriptional regulator [Alistipes sp.]MCD7795502.1 helix-turn-helix transcriptional regulator [Alistipes sp.]MCD8274621.1 helix-turn-helix transcriptional regulator [Alistipes sp.]
MNVERYELTDVQVLQHVGLQLKQMRLEQNITQKELQQLSGVSAFSISSVENGKNTSVLTLIQLLRALRRFDVLEPFFREPQVSPIAYARLMASQPEKKRVVKSKKVDRKQSNPLEEW